MQQFLQAVNMHRVIHKSYRWIIPFLFLTVGYPHPWPQGFSVTAYLLLNMRKYPHLPTNTQYDRRCVMQTTLTYIDRSNVSYAALQFKPDLHLSNTEYGLGAGELAYAHCPRHEHHAVLALEGVQALPSWHRCTLCQQNHLQNLPAPPAL